MGESRIENILEATIAGEPYNKEPQSRIEKDLLELKEVIEQGGTSDYDELENKPKINNVELDGNKSFADLGLPNPMHIAGRVDTVSELPQTATVGDVYLVGLVNADKDEYVYTTSGWEFLGSSTATDYSDLTNKPSINSIPLTGNKTSSDLGLQSTLVIGTNLDNTPVENSTNPITSGGVYAVVGDINLVLEEVL